MTDTLLVTLRRRPKPNGGHHFMFVDHRNRAGFVASDVMPSNVGDQVTADVQMVPSQHWPRWKPVRVYGPFGYPLTRAESAQPHANG